MTGDNHGEAIIRLDGFRVTARFEVEAFPDSYGVPGSEFTAVDVTSLDEVTVSDALHTIATGGHHGLVSAFLAKNYTGVVGSSAKEPVHTITAKDHNSLVVSHLSKMKNNCIGQELSEPIHTMTTVNQFAEVRAFLTAFYGNEKDGNSIGEPLRTIPTRDRFGLVTVGQQQYQIVDIGFRMLQPVELFKAQGFPDSYIFEKGLDEHGTEIRLTKTEQTRMVGNSVCPQLSRALVEANFKHESKYRGAA